MSNKSPALLFSYSVFFLLEHVKLIRMAGINQEIESRKVTKKRFLRLFDKY